VTYFRSTAYQHGVANSWLADRGTGLEIRVRLKYCSTSRWRTAQRRWSSDLVTGLGVDISRNKSQKITATQCFALGRTIGVTFDIKLGMSDGKLTYRELRHKTLNEGDHLEHFWHGWENNTKWTLLCILNEGITMRL